MHRTYLVVQRPLFVALYIRDDDAGLGSGNGVQPHVDISVSIHWVPPGKNGGKETWRTRIPYSVLLNYEGLDAMLSDCHGVAMSSTASLCNRCISVNAGLDNPSFHIVT